MLMAAGQSIDRRGVNLLDSVVPWYDTYTTADNHWMAVGARWSRSSMTSSSACSAFPTRSPEAVRTRPRGLAFGRRSLRPLRPARATNGRRCSTARTLALRLSSEGGRPTPGRAQHVHRSRRHNAAGTGAAVQPHRTANSYTAAIEGTDTLMSCGSGESQTPNDY
jgi:hypothetical protein